MRQLLLAVLAAAALAACSPAQCKCSGTAACIYPDASGASRCVPVCDADGGGCGAGTTCQCAGSCANCTDCVRVCL